MTENDNFRHYIGELDVTEDIDLMFKHIYDLMLANGGEGSGLNADMVDGYHASDFAPASLVYQLNQRIQTIKIGNRPYSGLEVLLELYASDVLATKNDDSSITVQEYLSQLETTSAEHTSAITGLQEKTEFLNTETVNKLSNFANNNLQHIVDNNVDKYYLDSDSVNGLSFSLVTQNQYDLLPKEQKEDPRNIFIINNNLDDDFVQSQYTPPSVLKASMDLQFHINPTTKNVEYSVDGGSSWKIFMPLVGTGRTEETKGLLYPGWFEDIKDTITNEGLTDQNDYPFLLNTTENQAILQKNPVISIKFDQNRIGYPNNDGLIDISSLLDTSISNWITANTSRITNLMPDISNLQSKTERITSSAGLTNNKTDSTYPTSKAVTDYVDTIKNNLTTAIGGKANSNHTHSQWQTYTFGGGIDNYAWLRYNPSIRIANFRYYRSQYNFTSTGPRNLHNGLIPASLRPVDDAVLSSYSYYIVGYIEWQNGNMRISVEKTGKYDINVSGMWRY